MGLFAFRRKYEEEQARLKLEEEVSKEKTTKQKTAQKPKTSRTKKVKGNE